jgi:hypothetical protein
MKLVGKDGILVVVEDDVSLKIFFDSMSGVASAIASDRPKKRFFYEKIGRNHMFAVDEKKRLFALLATHVVSSLGPESVVSDLTATKSRMRLSSTSIFLNTKVELSMLVEELSMQPNGSPKAYRNLAQ